MVKAIIPLRALTALALTTFLAFATGADAADGARPPNVVVILVDDLGWGELGCQGNTQIPTPNQDSIAADGTRFTAGHVAAIVCSPSRAGLMTGRYPTRFGHEYNPGTGDRASNSGLPLTETTFAQRMKTLGYATACVGKWHLGEARALYPTERGFDEFYGTLANTPYFEPRMFVDSRKGPQIPEMPRPFYTTEAYGARACEFIDANKDKPFFLYLPFNAMHGPLDAPATDMERARKLGIEDTKRLVFAAVMLGLDDAVGKVLAKLKEDGLEENTIVWYLSDNGGPTPETTSSNGVLRGFKHNTSEGGNRVPFMVKWPGKIPAGKTYDQPVLNLDILPTSVIAAGGAVPADWKLDGVDLMPFLTGKQSGRPHQTLYWRAGPQWAIEQDGFKLVASLFDDLKPRLISLKEDLSEKNDIGSSEEKKVEALKQTYETWNQEQSKPAWGPSGGGPADGGKKGKKGKKGKSEEE